MESTRFFLIVENKKLVVPWIKMLTKLLAQFVASLIAFVIFLFVIIFLSVHTVSTGKSGVPSIITTTTQPKYLTHFLVSQLAFTRKLGNVFLPNNPSRMAMLTRRLNSDPLTRTQLAICSLISPTSGGGSFGFNPSTRTLLPLYDYGQSGGWWCWAGNVDVGLSFEVTRVELCCPGARGHQMPPGSTSVYLVTMCVIGEAWGGAQRTDFEAIGATCHQTGEESFVLTGTSTRSSLHLRLASGDGSASLSISCSVGSDILVRADIMATNNAFLQLGVGGSRRQRWGGQGDARISVSTSADTWEFVGVPATLGGLAERRRWASCGWGALSAVSDQILNPGEVEPFALHLVLPDGDSMLYICTTPDNDKTQCTVIGGPDYGTHRRRPSVQILEKNQDGVPLACMYSDDTGAAIKIQTKDTGAWEYASNATRRWVMRGVISPPSKHSGTIAWWNTAQTSTENLDILELPEKYPSAALDPIQVTAYVFLILTFSILFAYVIGQPIALAIQKKASFRAQRVV